MCTLEIDSDFSDKLSHLLSITGVTKQSSWVPVRWYGTKKLIDVRNRLLIQLLSFHKALVQDQPHRYIMLYFCEVLDRTERHEKRIYSVQPTLANPHPPPLSPEVI